MENRNRKMNSLLSGGAINIIASFIGLFIITHSVARKNALRL